MRRYYQSPVDSLRCRATRSALSDGSDARCMLRIAQQGCKVCKTHRRMFREGKELKDHTTGDVMVSIINYPLR